MDEFRDLAEGRLTPEQERMLRERCAKDPELQAELERSLEAHRLTNAAAVRPPRCRVSFDEIEEALRVRRFRMLLISGLSTAAVLLLAFGAFAFGLFGGGGAAPATPMAITLRAIPLADVEAVKPDREIPEFLARYRSTTEDRILWLTDLQKALAASEFSERPVLVFLYHQGCPLSRVFLDRVLLDAEVRKEFDGLVPLLVDIVDAPVGLDIRKMYEEGIPWFGTFNSAGEEQIAFRGPTDPGKFAGELRTVKELDRVPSLSWDRLNALVVRILAARENEQADEWLCDADAEYRALSVECPEGPLRDAARRGLGRIEQRARQALLRAEILAAEGQSETALQALDREIEVFTDTPFAVDFQAARTYLRRHGRFPHLTIASR